MSSPTDLVARDCFKKANELRGGAMSDEMRWDDRDPLRS
jgi:hypothetical protein